MPGRGPDVRPRRSPCVKESRSDRLRQRMQGMRVRIELLVIGCQETPRGVASSACIGSSDRAAGSRICSISAAGPSGQVGPRGALHSKTPDRKVERSERSEVLQSKDETHARVPGNPKLGTGAQKVALARRHGNIGLGRCAGALCVASLLLRNAVGCLPRPIDRRSGETEWCDCWQAFERRLGCQKSFSIADGICD